MKTETREIYRCGHCNKLYLREGFCKRHEKGCFYNPDNSRPCLDCVSLVKKKHTIYSDNGNNEYDMVISCFYCDAKKVFMYPPIVEHKRNAIDLADELNGPMPKKCSKYNDGISF